MLYALALGALGGFASLLVLGLIKLGGRWYSDPRPGWFGGYWWWVAITATAGLMTGLLRRLTRLPEEVPGLFDDMQAAQVDLESIPGTVVVSLMSLIGGASVGPEKVLGTIGGGAGTWIARRRSLSEGHSQVNGARDSFAERGIGAGGVDPAGPSARAGRHLRMARTRARALGREGPASVALLWDCARSRQGADRRARTRVPRAGRRRWPRSHDWGVLRNWARQAADAWTYVGDCMLMAAGNSRSHPWKLVIRP